MASTLCAPECGPTCKSESTGMHGRFVYNAMYPAFSAEGKLIRACSIMVNAPDS